MKDQIERIANKAMSEVNANKLRVKQSIASGLYSKQENTRQEQEVAEKNAVIIRKMKEELVALRADVITRANEADIASARKSDAEIANILAMLSLSSSTLGDQEINDLYTAHYHSPLIRRSIEGIAKAKGSTLYPVKTKAIEMEHMVNQIFGSYLKELSPTEINANLEVVSAVMSVNRGV